jgi:hypothetical protein
MQMSLVLILSNSPAFDQITRKDKLLLKTEVIR